MVERCWPARVRTQQIVAACILGLLGATSAPAQQEDLEKPPEIPPAGSYEEPPIPPKVQEEQIEPEVTIREEEGQRVEEYSYNGRVYMVKITPVGGIAYYYIDTDGDGRLETTPGPDGLEPVRPVYWKIKEWD